MNAGDLIKRSDSLLSERSSYHDKWQQITDQIAPHRGGFTREVSPGEKRPDILDSTGIQAHRMLAAGLHGMLTNPSQQWFSLKPKDEELREDHAAMVWLEEVARRCYNVFNATEGNFKAQVHELYQDLCGIGNAAMYMPDEPGRGILFSTVPFSQICLGEDAEGRVNTIYRRFKLRANQAVGKWGNKAGEKVVKAAGSEKKDDQFDFLHCVQPRADGQPGAVRHRKPISSCWVSLHDKSLIDEGGFEENPYLTPRWEKAAGEVYGSGAGEVALADLKMLQRVMRVTIRGSEKMIDPTLLVPDDGVIGLVRTNPSGLIHVRADLMSGQASPIRPLVTGGQPGLGEELMEGIRNRVRGAFYWNFLQMMQDPRMTATQVIAMQEEVLRIMGPVLGRQESEFLGPLINRVFNILMRAGALPPPPESLQGREIEIEYMSPVARAQRAGEAQAIMRSMDALGSIMNLDPSVKDNVDFDAAYRRLTEHYGCPKDLMRDPAKMEKQRAAQAQAAEDAHRDQQMAASVQTAATAAQALPALKEALTPASQVVGNA